ncbi:MAG TPA: methyltransferase domain-containing protein [Pyrinomonadaceae bacterium]|nr:methyltransferase domain-containing protein [Pyrinomonadaceae bacterium]
MLEISDSEIKVDRLMHEIREAVARERQGANVSATPPPPPPGDGWPGVRAEFSPLSLQPQFQSRPDNEYHVNDLLKYHGGDFVRNAYRAILKREPDAEGFARYIESLASGRFNKIDVLSSLRHSTEGERAGVKINGLAWPAAVRRAGRAPVIGYLIQLMVALGRLPHLLQQQRQSEFYLLSQQQRVVDHHNEAHERLAQSLEQSVAQLSAQAAAGADRDAAQQQSFETLARQQHEEAVRHVEFRNAVEARLTAVREHVEQSAAELTRQMGERAETLSRRVDESEAAFARRVEESAAELARQLEERVRRLLDSHKELTEQVDEQARQFLEQHRRTRDELAAQERRLTWLLEKARETASSAPDQSLALALANEEERLLDHLYASFEDQFRGSREEVTSRLRVYLPVLDGAGVTGDVLDIGCGRGEWLELLKSEGIVAHGVDLNRVFIEQCRRRGLDVVEEDALVYLRGLPDRSLSVVTSFHLVEHLPFGTLIKMLDESVRALKPGGLLILETPNPENFMVGSCNFYADPTHRNPIPSPTLKFLLEARGLERVEVMKLRPWDAARIEGDAEIVKRFNEYFYSAPDYAVIGRKI